LVLALVAVIGRTLTGLVIVLGITGWAQYTRVIRSMTLSLTEADFVEAAKAVGGRPSYILLRHLLPNLVSPIIVLSTLGISQVILIESAISFLGLGPAPPDATWGGMIGEGRNYIYAAWWSAFFPGLVIFLTVMCLNYTGDSIREAFDPFTARHARKR
jgi:peptide/nickel transport system permease protein